MACFDAVYRKCLEKTRKPGSSILKKPWQIGKN